LMQGDVAMATRWAERVAEDADASPFYPHLGLTQARLLLAQSEKTAAAEQLAARYETAVRAGWHFGVVVVRVLQSLAAATSEAALEFLTEALALAQPEGFIRTFADAGEPLVPLLQEAALQGVMPEYVGGTLAAIEGDRRMIVSEPLMLVEPLSEREIQVLRLVAAGLSNRQVAGKLIISLGTAKTHVHHIYGKLGVRNRVQAIARARELGLI
jgi:LuxR family maltose regulon positive regulatory protein